LSDGNICREFGKYSLKTRYNTFVHTPQPHEFVLNINHYCCLMKVLYFFYTYYICAILFSAVGVATY